MCEGKTRPEIKEEEYDDNCDDCKEERGQIKKKEKKQQL
jgi:hypothetical protein